MQASVSWGTSCRQGIACGENCTASLPADKSRNAIPSIALANLAAIPPVAALGLIFLYIGFRTGDLQAVMKVQNAWGARPVRGPPEGFRPATG